MQGSLGSLFINLGLNTAQFNAGVASAEQKAATAGTRIGQGFGRGAQGINVLTTSARSAQFAVANLGFQLNDVFTGFASGQRPMQIFAQQAGQFVQLFVQGGGIRNVLGGFATALRHIVTPATVAAAAITAVGASVIYLTARVVASESSMRRFGVMLKGLGLEGQASAASLEEAAKRLRDVGLTVGEARAALTAAVRSGISSPALAERVVRTGQNLIPILGEDAQQEFIQAIQGGIEPMSRLVRQLRLVTEEEIAAAREMAKFGSETAVMERWIGLIENRVKGLNREALGPLSQQLRDLRQAWSNFLDRLGQSGVIQTLVNALTDLANVLEKISKTGLGPWASVLAGAASGALVGRIAGPYGMLAGAAAGAIGGAYYGSQRSDLQGIDVEKTLDLIAQRESGNRNIHQGLVPRSVSTAQGYFQITNETWKDFAPPEVLALWQNAMAAPYNTQRDVARRILTSPKGGPGRWSALKGVALPQVAGGAGGIEITATGAGGEALTSGSAGAPGGAPGGGLSESESRERQFLADRREEFRAMTQEQDLLNRAAQDLAKKVREGGPGALTRVGAGHQATIETVRRFGYDISSTPERLALVEEQIAARRAQLIDDQRKKQILLFAEQDVQDRQRTEQLQLQASLFGKSSEEIEKQVALLRISQDAEAAGLETTDEAVQSRIRATEALQEQMSVLKQQQVIMNHIQEIGGVFENTFMSALDMIADGTFRVRDLLRVLADLGRTLAHQGFKALTEGSSAGGSGGGLFGMIGSLFGLGGAAGSTGGGTEIPGIDFGGGGDFPGAATGASWRVGGSGAIDSQLVAFRASPGEMIDVTPQGGDRGGGGGEVIRLELNPSEGWVAGVADRQIRTRSGAIVQVAVRQSQQLTRRTFNTLATESAARQA